MTGKLPAQVKPEELIRTGRWVVRSWKKESLVRLTKNGQMRIDYEMARPDSRSESETGFRSSGYHHAETHRFRAWSWSGRIDRYRSRKQVINMALIKPARNYKLISMWLHFEFHGIAGNCGFLNPFVEVPIHA